MIVLCVGDIHATKNRPVNRIDNYWETVKGKLNFIEEIAEKEGAEVIISPGDLTDTPSISYLEFCELFDILKKKYLVTTFGQHDLRYRTRNNTALYAIEKSIYPRFKILDGTHVFFNGNSQRITIQGCSYGSEIPKPMDSDFNILTIHKMIIEEKLWHAQEEFEPSNLFLRKNKFDLIVSGDNHRGFIHEGPGKRFLFNCGSMMRSTIVQIDHKPFIVVFDTVSKTYKQVFIPIEPYEKVFQMDKVETEKERNKNLELFVKGLNEQKEIGLKFEDNLLSYCQENQIEISVIDEIKEAMKG